MNSNSLIIHINDSITAEIKYGDDKITLCEIGGGSYDDDGFVTLTKEEFKKLYQFLFVKDGELKQ